MARILFDDTAPAPANDRAKAYETSYPHYNIALRQAVDERALKLLARIARAIRQRRYSARRAEEMMRVVMALDLPEEMKFYESMMATQYPRPARRRPTLRTKQPRTLVAA